LAIAIGVVMMATAHAAISSRIHSLGKWETGTYLSGAVPSLSGSASLVSTGNKSPRISDRPRSVCQDNFDGPGGCHDQMRSRGVIVTVSDDIPALTVLSPAAPRGPPGSNNQIDAAAGRPSAHCSTFLPPSETHLYDSPAARIAFQNDANQSPIRSAIEGDPT